MASWEESKKIGDSFEEFVMNNIANVIGYKSIKNEDTAKYKYYDLTIKENNLTIECKYDVKGFDTKNVCIETHCNGNKSGISTSTADFWVISDGHEIYLIKNSDIKRCIYDGYVSLYPEEPTKFLHMKNYPVIQEDGATKLMGFYTIPSWLFKEYCVEVGKINELTYKELL